MELLTGKALEKFKTWLLTEGNKIIKDGNIEYDLYYIYLYLLPENLKCDLIIEWLDSVELFIKIHPHLGGGQCVFYPSICYRDKDVIDIEINMLFDNGEYFYTTDRNIATTEAIKKAVEIYNEKHI